MKQIPELQFIGGYPSSGKATLLNRILSNDIGELNIDADLIKQMRDIVNTVMTDEKDRTYSELIGE